MTPNNSSQRWIWQRPGWPAFTWKAQELSTVLSKARRAQGELSGVAHMLDVAGTGGFEEGMSNKKYSHLTTTSPATAQRDLADLVAKKCLILVGSGRTARYELALF